ncbi:methyltransferase domain-containing protein [Asticcacaulis sp. DXS10W]|uniref:Methyltransferase domain-containing protein n=1 Tax=Asticcacaulis currens TaxID=2984210 RepID=A0ABT5I9W4_9CAUL|nr:methyltransferase domain-containing protein [Asticcacaulis currens]MDC7692817.1 methyltransferase domain-containing protein [Asticcacaulis currens]
MFTAHNIRLDDGTDTLPDAGWYIKDSPWLLAAARVLNLYYRANITGKSIADLGCLEGGYTLEFARLGMQSTGIEVRQSNYDNCMRVANGTSYPNMNFVKDDVWNLGKHGPFDAIFCSGLLYHLSEPAEFIRLMGENARDVVIIHTHYATEADGSPFNLSPMTENEGLPGRWYAEHDSEDLAEIENFKWTSWKNKKSFWLTKAAILSQLQAVGFNIVFEQFDWIHDGIISSMKDGYYATQQRGVFVGLRA